MMNLRKSWVNVSLLKLIIKNNLFPAKISLIIFTAVYLLSLLVINSDFNVICLIVFAFSAVILTFIYPCYLQSYLVDKNKSAFINFNYTQTLENLYAILSSNILYIHGCAVKNDKLIFGHNKTPDKLLENWQDNYSQEELSALVEASNELSVLYKDVKSIIENNCTFWESIKYANKIHVWGLSLSDVDMPYISHIHSILNNDGIEWEFSWFAEPDKNRIMEIVNRLQIKDYKLIKLVDIMY